MDNNYQLQNQRAYELQMELQAQYRKNSEQLNFIAARENILGNKRMELEKQKFAVQEERWEKRKARYEEIILQPNGELELQVKNSVIDAPKRHLVNFVFVDIVKLTGLEKRERSIYMVSIRIGGNEFLIPLRKDKSGNEQYLLKKFTEVGAQFYADKKSEKLKYVVNLWGVFLTQCKTELRIPEYHGWIKDDEGRFHFIKEGESLWEDVEKMAK